MLAFYSKLISGRLTARLTVVGAFIALTAGASILVQPPVSAGRAIWSPGEAMDGIEAGSYSSCAIADGKLYCWGTNSSGVIGTNSVGINSVALEPTPVETSGLLSGKIFTDVGLNRTGSACALTSEGRIYCWGANGYGEFGNGTKTDSTTPVATDVTGVLSGKTIAKFTIGDGHACAVASDNKAYCWGSAGSGRVGNRPSVDSLTPAAVYDGGVLAGKSVTDISAGLASTCAVADGKVYCWGSNSSGQLGVNSSVASAPEPVAVYMGGVMNGQTIIKVEVGQLHSCALSNTSRVFCWGKNNEGQLGNATNITSLAPVEAIGSLAGKSIKDISLGGDASCALDNSGSSYCWGVGPSGDGVNFGSRSSPVAVATSGYLNGVGLLKIGVGSRNTTCTASATMIFCWGANDNYQMSTGNNYSTNAPVFVRSAEPFGTSAYRFYENENSVTPGEPIGATNTATMLKVPNQKFRLRMDVNAGTHGIVYGNPINSFKLQYAVKTATTCGVQASGFSDVANPAWSKIGFSSNTNVADGANITENDTDPVANSVVSPQIYKSSSGNFSNTSLVWPSKKGLWDFSLKDNGSTPGTTYCMRLVYGDNTPLESNTAFPEITIATPKLDVGIVDAGGASVAEPNFSLSNAMTQSTCQTTTGNIGTSAQRIRVFSSLSSTAWSLSMAATNGATASWQRSGGGPSYDFNDVSGSPPGCNSGPDGDGIAGQLSINPSTATITPKSGCSATGISKGSSSAFSQGATDAVTLASASSSAQFGCHWDFTGVGMSQKIPAFQESGLYSIDMTLTVVAQ